MGDFENPILKLIIIDGYKHRVQVTLIFTNLVILCQCRCAKLMKQISWVSKCLKLTNLLEKLKKERAFLFFLISRWNSESKSVYIILR